jgi:hypothetical protein
MPQEMGFRRLFVNRVIVPLLDTYYIHVVMEGAVARKPTDTVKLQLRLPEALRRRLERLAARNERSMNAEIIHRLQRTFAIDDSTAATNMLDFFRAMGVGITEANEKDVAIALGNTFGRWISAASITQGAAKAKPMDDKEGVGQ